MDDDIIAEGITFVFTLFFAFLGIYLFSLTNAPFLFLLFSIASFGYIFVLLAYYFKNHKKTYWPYLLFGALLIVICLFISFAYQDKPNIL